MSPRSWCSWQKDMRSTRGRGICFIQGGDKEEDEVEEGDGEGERVEVEAAETEAKTGDSNACLPCKVTHTTLNMS